MKEQGISSFGGGISVSGAKWEILSHFQAYNGVIGWSSRQGSGLSLQRARVHSLVEHCRSRTLSLPRETSRAC